jgi:uncharacterized protein (TIGR02466 family)
MPHQIASFFPTLVSLVAYPEAGRFHAPARARIQALQASGQGLVKPGQWQSGPALHQDPVFQPFARFVLTAAAERFAALEYGPTEVGFTGMWANVNTPGYAHPVHAHSNNFLSGVYYVTAPEGAGGLVFLDPRKQHQVLVPTLAQITPMNSTAARLPAEEGQMILFPAWLEHYTEANQSAAPRISIAFNLMLTGAFGSAETFAAGAVKPIG